MSPCFTGPAALFFLVVFAAVAKGDLDTQRNNYQMILPECSSPQFIQEGGADVQMQTAIEKPPMNYQVETPAPKVVGHTVHIFKTILTPQTFRQMVIVPYLQRYVRTFQAPVLETVHIQREIPF